MLPYTGNFGGHEIWNHLDKYLVNLKFGDLQDQIENYDIITHATYAYSHFSLVAARLQKMETYEVDSCVHGHNVFQGIWNPTTSKQLVYDLGLSYLAVALSSYTCTLTRARARYCVCIWPALVSNYWQPLIWQLTSESPNRHIKNSHQNFPVHSM